MARGSPEAGIVGGIFLILLDIYGISEGHLPLKGQFNSGIDLAQNPTLFWAYSASLGILGIAGILWGLWRRD